MCRKGLIGFLAAGFVMVGALGCFPDNNQPPTVVTPGGGGPGGPGGNGFPGGNAGPLCQVCNLDCDCGGNGNLCLSPVGSDPNAPGFCSIVCQSDSDCPDGFACQQIGSSSGNGQVAGFNCVPASGGPCILPAGVTSTPAVSVCTNQPDAGPTP